jgi:hypothetical protein
VNNNLLFEITVAGCSLLILLLSVFLPWWPVGDLRATFVSRHVSGTSPQGAHCG